MAEITETEARAKLEISNAPRSAATMIGGFAMVPEGFAVTSLEEFQGLPNRIRTDHQFRNTRSLADYVNIHGTPETTLFSAPRQQEILAVIDYHKSDGTPSHGDHSATFCAQFGSAYKKWRGIHGRAMKQVEAGLFLEERAADVSNPDAASIMDMVMQFDALKKVTFKQSTRLHDGQRQFTYNEENEVRGNVTLPEKIALRVSVFEGMEPQEVLVRVKYRINDGMLIFVFEIHDKDDLEDAAFAKCEDALLVDISDDYPLFHTA